MPTKKGFLPYPLKSFQGRNPGNFWLAFWEKWWPYEFILNLTDLYWLAATRNPNVPLEFALLTLFPLGRDTFFLCFHLNLLFLIGNLTIIMLPFSNFNKTFFFNCVKLRVDSNFPLSNKQKKKVQNWQRSAVTFKVMLWIVATEVLCKQFQSVCTCYKCTDITTFT